MKLELKSDKDCNACVDAGRTGHEVMASGWSKALSKGKRTLRLL